MPSTQIDSRVRIVTPENIAFEYRVAGPSIRFGAYLIDLVVLIGSYLVAAMLFSAIAATLDLPGVGRMFVAVTFFSLFWFYGGVFEWLWSGQTPGKRINSLRVLRTDGRPVTAIQAILRNLVRLVDLLPWLWFPDFFGEDAALALPTCLVGLATMAATRSYQRLGDLVCGTMVVAEEPAGSGRAARDWLAAEATTRDPALREVLARLPASYQPSRTLARALSHYAGRRRYFSPARRREIARHVGEPLVERLGLPADTDHDLLLCALYARAFLSESPVDSSDGGDASTPVGAPPAGGPAPAPAPAAGPPAPLPPTPTANA